VSALDVLLTLDAAATGNAQRRCTVRHRYLSYAPMVIVAYRMSGEAGAPLGVCFGTSRDDATVLVAPEPRNRTIRFREVLNPLAASITSWLSNFEYMQPDEKKPDRLVCVQAPQIFVPNRSTASFVSSVLGRSLRYLRNHDDFPIPEPTRLLGTHMTWFDQQSQVPGSCVMSVATDLLRRHWATGQSSLEDEDLHVLLGWINPPDGLTGAAAAEIAEEQRLVTALPSIGPTPDPQWDRDVLDKAISRFNAARGSEESAAAVEAHGGAIQEAVETVLGPGWHAAWDAHELMLSWPVGDSGAARWTGDKQAWTSHVKRVQDGEAFFRIKDTAKQAAFAIASFERAQRNLDIGEALDDPLVIAALVANGDALLGTVVDQDASNTEPGRGRARYRPLIVLELDDPCPIPLGGKLAWRENPKMRAAITAIDGHRVTLTVFAGMGTSRNANPLPAIGSDAVFADVNNSSPPSPRPPQDVPWTHVGVDTPRYLSEIPE